MAKEIEEFKELHDLARRLNVSRKTVERWLSGKAQPSKEQLKEIRTCFAEPCFFTLFRNEPSKLSLSSLCSEIRKYIDEKKVA